MRELQEFIYGYSNGYNTRTCVGCTLSQKEVSEYSGMGAVIDKERPCIEFSFDNKQNNMVAVLLAKQHGAGNVQASYRHVFVLRRLNVEDFRSREILPFFDIGFVSQKDVAAIVAGTKVFNKVVLSNPNDNYDRVIGTNLLVQIICDVIYSDYIMSKNQITLVVPDDMDQIDALRTIAKQVLDSIPYGLSNRFSFSVNSTDCRIRIVGRLENMESTGTRYYLSDEPREINTKLLPTLVKLIRECVEDKNTREFVYQSFEKQYNGEFPKTASYMSFSDVYAMMDSQIADWEYFERINNVLCSIGKQFGPELKNRIIAVIPDSDVLSGILMSNDSAFVNCDSLDKLENTLKEYWGILDYLAEEGIKPNLDFTNHILTAIELPKGYKELADERRFLELGGTMLERFLDKTAIANRCATIDSAMNAIIENYFDGFKSKLGTAIQDMSVREFDSACKDAERQPFYDRDRCSRVIAFMLENPCGYSGVCEELYNCALRHANKTDLERIENYVACIQESNRTKETMKDYKNYLKWIMSSNYNEDTAEEYLNTVFINAKRSNYVGTDICDLIDAFEQVCGKYAFDKSSNESQMIKTILNNPAARILLNKNKSLATVYRELLFCRFNSVFSIIALLSDGTTSYINVAEAVDSLQKVLNHALFSSDFESTDKYNCAMFAQYCSLTQKEAELLCDEYDEYTANNNQKKHKGKKKNGRQPNSQQKITETRMIILFAVAALLIIGAAIFSIVSFTKGKDPVPLENETLPTVVPSVSRTDNAVSSADPIITFPEINNPTDDPGMSGNTSPVPKDERDPITPINPNSGANLDDDLAPVNGNNEWSEGFGNTEAPVTDGNLSSNTNEGNE